MDTLLYGRDVDRTAKARARIGLAILIFALGYAVIAGRLVLFAALPEGHTRRVVTHDAVATARLTFSTATGNPRNRRAHALPVRGAGGSSTSMKRPSC